ncbi:MAG: hypothetical protein KC713_07955, partial [Candidatus Omnitrophica bacterium]|nr:hypothetical protein [Candidatus Omnitrophota bacterium]
KSDLGRVFSHQRIPKSVELKPNRPAHLFKNLQEQDALPCIYFAFSRKLTQYLAEEIKHQDFLKPDEKVKIKQAYVELCRKFDIEHEPSTYELLPLIENGIAYHHAGMLPTLKEVIERLFTTRLIKVIFTTETFALGINMPARTVIFDELKKFYERSFRILKTRDFYQMAGRAGRRSIDTEGNVFIRVNPHYVSLRELEGVIEGEPEKVISRFNASYATLLNLYEKFGEDLYEIYPLSFHFHQEKKGSQKKAIRMLRDKVTLLKQLGHIRKNKLTEKGIFASHVFGYELILSELHELGVLDKLSMNKLALLIMSIVYEPRKGMRKPKLNHDSRSLSYLTEDVLRPINRLEKKLNLTPLTKACFFHLSEAMQGWLNGESFNEILEKTQVDEGEVVRYFRMCIQVMREMLEAPTNEELKSKMYKLMHKINRDVVDAEKQLRG